MSKDRHDAKPDYEKEATRLMMLGYHSIAAALRERDAKVEQAEAERDHWKRELDAAVEHVGAIAEKNVALKDAIQRGYCPQCGVYGQALKGQTHLRRNHSPDCRVAPLLTSST